MQSVPSNAEAIAQWSAIPEADLAAYDPDGDFEKRHLLNQTVFDLLGDVTGQRVLDAGAGQGYFSRLLARKGAIVTSLEPAAGLIAHSYRMETQEPLGIDYVQADLTTVELPADFDAVVANLVFDSIHDWERALVTCAGALRAGGTFIFAVEHPWFEVAQQTGEGSDNQLLVDDYLTERPLERPVATDFHRTLSTYLNATLRAGIQLVQIAEPQLPAAAVALPDAPAQADLLTRVPNFLIVRGQKAATPGNG